MSFAAVVLSVLVAPVAHVHRLLNVTVRVTAAPAVLDDRMGSLRVQVKLARECGGTFAATPGPVLLDRALRPQPTTGHAYTAAVRGSGRPRRTGTRTVCVYLDDDYRMYANDTSHEVRVLPARAQRRRRRRLAAVAAATMPPIKHVFIIVLENESATTTFGAGSPAPYLAHTLRAQGAFLPDYYGIGHASNDNYIAMISGQAPNLYTQADCLTFVDVWPGTIGDYGQAQGLGCVYPGVVRTIAQQLQVRGLTWRDYNDGMGADPQREASECGHPGLGMVDGTQSATAADQYASRHNPFVYFHSIIDDTALCDSHVVNLDLLPHDLATAANTPNYVFITPDLCDDGHDAKCASGGRGGLPQADAFLKQWVPRITGSPAFKRQNGLLIVTFDEAATTDARACCGEIAGPGSLLPGLIGPGGGDTGAVLLSPCIAPGTISRRPYNHYTMLRSVEDIFGLGHLGYAGLPGERSFGADVFTRACEAPHKPARHKRRRRHRHRRDGYVR